VHKDITFSSFLVLINEKAIDENSFFSNFPDNREIKTSKNETNYTLRFSKENAFSKISIEFGNPFSRPDNVINTDTLEPESNPRQSNQYEPKQDFALIDLKISILWLSNANRKPLIHDILEELHSEVTIKSVYNEDEFIKQLKKFEEIRFSAFPNLFSQTNTLSKELSDEILGYGASIAILIMKFSSQNLTSQTLLGKVINLIKNKESYKSLVISGRDKEDFGIVFNNEVLQKKVTFKAKINTNEIYDIHDVYENLILKIE
jgi:hypothetical protein